MIHAATNAVLFRVILLGTMTNKGNRPVRIHGAASKSGCTVSGLTCKRPPLFKRSLRWRWSRLPPRHTPSSLRSTTRRPVPAVPAVHANTAPALRPQPQANNAAAVQPQANEASESGWTRVARRMCTIV
jgi:hypothetical protein